MLEAKCLRSGRLETREIAVERLVIAGWTGRDPAAVAAHVAELGVLGVPPPASIPTFYHLNRELLTTRHRIDVVGDRSSGEVEAVIVLDGDRWWVTVGSDHTDRDLERVSVTKSKQACSKPIADVLWAFEDVADHWDELQLRCHIVDGASRMVYQQGLLSGNLRPESLIREWAIRGGAGTGAQAVLFCGTQPVIGEVRGGDRFEIELYDPVLDRRIRHEYGVRVLPDLG